MHDYLAARTAFFDRVVTGAIAAGTPQIVVGAAGYDGRALRYAKPGVRWFEVDHPATQRDKLARLGRLGIDASGVGFAEADFAADPVATRLLEAGLDPSEPSLFLLEGVAVYLEQAVLERVLDQLRDLAAPGSRLAISVSLSRPAGDAARARFQAAVASMGEPARSILTADEARALLARAGWHLSQEASAGEAGPEQAGTERAGTERARAAGLLTADAGPREEPPARRGRPGPRGNRGRPGLWPRTGICPSRFCCPRRWWRSPSSATTRASTGSRTARPTMASPGTATVPGWCPWSCSRTACGTWPGNR